MINSMLYKWIILMSTLMPVQDDSLSNDKQEILKAHNKARQEVNVDPLEWSDEMESLAQEWADRLAQTGILKHRPLKGRYGTKKGENIAYFTNEKKILDGIKLWLMEKKYYWVTNLNRKNDRT